jgi:uncharacterized protein
VNVGRECTTRRPRFDRVIPPRVRLVLRLLGLGLVALAMIYVGSVFALQRSWLFPHPAVPVSSRRPDDARQVWLSTSTGPIEAWYLPPVDSPTRPSPLIIFFHGNGELIDTLPEEFIQPRRAGIAVLLVEYPGYGRSSGSPSQASITLAALAAFDWAKTQTDVDSTRVVAQGRSLGGAAAAILAANRPTAALVLESTFTSVRSFARSFWVPEVLVRDPFDTVALLPHHHQPILLLHGDHDELVPPSHATTLSRAARQAELHFLPCGHNDCMRPWSLVLGFLTDARILPK